MIIVGAWPSWATRVVGYAGEVQIHICNVPSADRKGNLAGMLHTYDIPHKNILRAF